MRIARYAIGYGLEFAAFLIGGFECAWGNIPSGIALGCAGIVLMLVIVPRKPPGGSWLR